MLHVGRRHFLQEQAGLDVTFFDEIGDVKTIAFIDKEVACGEGVEFQLVRMGMFEVSLLGLSEVLQMVFLCGMVAFHHQKLEFVLKHQIVSSEEGWKRPIYSEAYVSTVATATRPQAQFVLLLVICVGVTRGILLFVCVFACERCRLIDGNGEPSPIRFRLQEHLFVHKLVEVV